MTAPAPLVERWDGALAPIDAYRALAHLPTPILLDSAAAGPRGRYSFVMADPVLTIRSSGGVTEVKRRHSDTPERQARDALSVVRSALGGFAAEPTPGLPPFQCGAAGYIAYDWGETLERLPSPRYDDLNLPDLLLGVYATVIAWDHEQRGAWIISRPIAGADPQAELSDIKRWLGAAPQAREAPVTAAPVPVVPTWTVPDLVPMRVRSTFSPPAYCEAVRRAREFILAGDVFQVNISQRFEVDVDRSPMELYLSLRRRHPACFGALMETDAFAVLSASPERFLRVAGTHVETRPIKGTRPRSAVVTDDAALGAELLGSAKDRAENVMIVDLMRNDLSRVCRAGTVRASELCVLESHPTVHHLVSTVDGDLRPDADATDLLRAAFPGGSITGAPKIRAMEIIAELEPTRRGVYCGAIGYVSATGAMDTSIAIRTAVVRNGTAYVSAGGGITVRSAPDDEYRETLDKARGVLAALTRT